MAATAFSLIGRISMQGISESLKQVEGLEGKVKKLQKEMGNLAKSFNQAGAFLTKNLTLPMAAAATAIGALSLKTGEYASKLSSLEQETGLTSDTLQEFEHVAKVTGGSSDALFGSITALTNKLPEIAQGSGDAAKALDQLGINVTNADGSYRDMNQLFPEIIGKLSGIEDITTRNTIATDIFGKKSKELATFMGMSASEMNKLRGEAHGMGLVMSKDALKSADDFRIGVENLKAQLVAVGHDVATKVIPILNESLIPLLQSTLIPALKGTADAVGVLAKGFGSLPSEVQTVTIALGGVVAALGPIALGVGKVIGIAKSLIPVLSSLAVSMGAATAGASGLGTALMGLATGIALPLAAIAALTSAVVVCYREFSTLKRLKEEAAEDEKFSQQTQALYKTAMAAKKLRDEYEQLRGTDKFDSTEFDKLQRGYEDATIALQNHNRVRQGMQTLNEQELVQYRNKLRGIKEVSEAEKRQTEYAAAQAKERAKAYAEEAAKRKKELADMIADYDEKYERLFMSAEELNRHEEELAVQKAIKAKATEEQIFTIRQYYNELRQQMEDEAEKKRAEEADDEAKTLEEKQRKIYEGNAKWSARLLEQDLDDINRKISVSDGMYKAELAATEGSFASQMPIHKKYADERVKLTEEMAQKQLEILNAQYQSEIANAEKEGLDIKAIQESYAREKLNIERTYADEQARIEAELTQKAEQEVNRRMSLLEKWSGAVSTIVSKIGGLWEALSAKDERLADNDYKRRKEEIEATVKDEEEKAKLLAENEEAYEEKKKAIQKEQAKRQKALSIFTIITDTAAAVMRAIKDFGFIAGGIMGAVIAGLGVAQIATVASTPEPFFDGGLVKGSQTGIHAQVGERNQDELIMPLDRGVDMLADRLSSQGSVGDSYNYTVNVNVGSLIGDDKSIKQLGRKIREVIVAEDRRTGVST